MKFRPCIDLHAGKVKQLVGSTLLDGEGGGLITNFETDLTPAYFAQLYRRDALSGGHVIMLGPGNESAAHEALQAFPGGLHIGGGITPGNAREFLDAGASHVIVTSYVFKNGLIHWPNLECISKTVGKQRLVLDVSCAKTASGYFIATDRWQNRTDVAVTAETLGRFARFCDEFLVHAVDVEGKQGGIDELLVEILSRSSPIAVTYAGGIRNIADLDLIDKKGLGKVDATVGSALDIFGGSLHYADVVQWHKRHIH